MKAFPRAVEQSCGRDPGAGRRESLCVVTRLAALLRRLADRIDPRQQDAAGVPWPASEDAAGPATPPPERGTIEQIRDRQDERLHEILFLIERYDEHDPASGLMWWESWQLEVVKDLLDHELRLREHQFEKLGAAGQ
jgi:hypothetical protein